MCTVTATMPGLLYLFGNGLQSGVDSDQYIPYLIRPQGDAPGEIRS